MASWKTVGLLLCVIAALQLAVAEVVCHWNGETFEKKTVTASEVTAELCIGSVLPWTRRGCVDYDGNCNGASSVRELCLAQGGPGHYACQDNKIVCVQGPAPCEDDSSCNDHNACTTDTCTSPNCLHTNVVCPGVDQCHAVAACDPLTGCPAPTVTEGATCDDGDACTENDQCQSDGTCQGTPRRVQQRRTSVQAPATVRQVSVCTIAPLAVDTACDDNDLCTATSSCNGSGVCVGSNPVVCTASDQCHDVGTCDSNTGLCWNPAKPNGSMCNDVNLCTQSDTCQVGVCVGASPVVCSASDQCHDVGTCNPSTGQCSDPVSAVNTPCNDQSCNTVNDVCDAAGQCAGTACSLSHATPDCSSLIACAVGQCEAGYGNCNSVHSDGCETDLQTSEARCGVCNNACGVDHECYEGACVSVKTLSFDAKFGVDAIPTEGLFDYFTAVKAAVSSTAYSNSYFYYSMSQTKSDGTSAYLRFCYAHANVVMENYFYAYTNMLPGVKVLAPADVWFTLKSFPGVIMPWSSALPGDLVRVSFANYPGTERYFQGLLSRSDPNGVNGEILLQFHNQVSPLLSVSEARISFFGIPIGHSGTVFTDPNQFTTVDLRAGTDKLSVCGIA